MAEFTYQLYRKAGTEDSQEAVYQLGCLIARAHGTLGLPYDLIGLKVNLSENQARVLGEDHMRASEKGTSWEVASALVDAEVARLDVLADM